MIGGLLSILLHSIVVLAVPVFEGNNGSTLKSAKIGMYERIAIIPDGQWHYFNFTSVGVKSPQIFNFTISVDQRFQVVDLFCVGDQFSVYDNSTALGLTSLPLSPSCAISAPTPDTATFGTWSYLDISLKPGFHEISIIPAVSPYGVGKGAIRLGLP